MIKVWLDDERQPPAGWLWAKSYDEAVTILTTMEVDIMSLDHDLGESSFKTGYDLVRWMAENDCWPKKEIFLHTQNSVGRENMKQMINRYSPFHLYY